MCICGCEFPFRGHICFCAVYALRAGAWAGWGEGDLLRGILVGNMKLLDFLDLS